MPYLPLLLILSLTAVIYHAWTVLESHSRLRHFAAAAALGRPREPPYYLTLATRLLGWYQRSTLPKRLAQAGHPRLIGKTPHHFYASKLFFALAFGLRFGNRGLGTHLLWAVIGFFFPDLLLYLAIRRRHEQILEQLPVLLDHMAVALSGPGGLSAALAALPERLSGPLREEVTRLAAEYALTKDLPRSLQAFADRIGVEEIDQFCLALRQAEQTGRVRQILTSQSQALQLRLTAARRRQLATQTNFLPVVNVLMVADLLLLIGLPLIYQLSDTLSNLR